MLKFQENVNLSDLSNYKIGGPARFFFEAKSADEIADAVAMAKEKKLKIFILGGGTNLLISDEGYDGLVLAPKIEVLESSKDKIRVGAGVQMAELLNFSVKEGLSGLEWAGGLPGTVGGAIRGNAGCFGGEIKDNISEVESFDVESEEKRIRKNEECEFDYRDSVFKKSDGREIVLSAVFKLTKGDPRNIETSISEKIEYRKARHPLEYPNIGSIFENVPVEKVPQAVRAKCADVIKLDPFPVVPAARLITLSGLKGTRYGGAMISEKHGNFIVNMGGAKAADVKYLIALIKKEIKNKFGVALEEEVQLV